MVLAENQALFEAMPQLSVYYEHLVIFACPIESGAAKISSPF
jgi:hypothetical protein